MNDTSAVRALNSVFLLALDSFWPGTDLKENSFSSLLSGVFDFIAENRSMLKDEGHLATWLDSNGRSSLDAWRLALAIDVSNHILNSMSEQDLLALEGSITCRENRKELASFIFHPCSKNISRITKEYIVVRFDTGEHQSDHCRQSKYNAGDQYDGYCDFGVNT